MTESETRLIEALTSAKSGDDRDFAMLAAENGLPPDVVTRVARGVGASSPSLLDAVGRLKALLLRGRARASGGLDSLARHPRVVWVLTSVPAGLLGVASNLLLATSHSAGEPETRGFWTALSDALWNAGFQWLTAGLLLQAWAYSCQRSSQSAVLFTAGLFANGILVIEMNYGFNSIDGRAIEVVARWGLVAAAYWGLLESVAVAVRFLRESLERSDQSRKRKLKDYSQLATARRRSQRYLHPAAFSLVKHARLAMFVTLAAVYVLLWSILLRTFGESDGVAVSAWIAGIAVAGVAFPSVNSALASSFLAFAGYSVLSYAQGSVYGPVPMVLIQLALIPIAMAGLAVASQYASTRAIGWLKAVLIGRGYYDVALLEIVRARRSLRAIRQQVFVVVVDAVESTNMKAGADPLTAELAFRMYQEIIGSTATQNQGRVLSVVGDGAIVVVQSASDAIGFARRVLEAVEAFNLTSNPLGKPFNLRIGVHHGFSQGDVKEVEYSHIIDVAAHIQSRARIGRIMVSESVVSVAPELHATPTGLTADGFKLFEVVCPGDQTLGQRQPQ